MPPKLEPSTARRLGLYVRSLGLPGLRTKQEAVVERLNQLGANGTIDDYTVDIWGKQVVESDAESTETGRRILSRIEEFRGWARAHEVSLEPSLRTDTVRSEITDEEYTRVALPAMTLAEYDGDELRFVSPCSDGERVVTVTDRLEAIGTVSQEPSANAGSAQPRSVFEGDSP